MSLYTGKTITLCEVGPRDGLQNEQKILSTDEKVCLIERAVSSGFKVVEVGSFMSPKAVPQMADTDEVFRRLTKAPGVEYRALIANMKGLERAADCGCVKTKLNVSASETHNLKNLNCTPAESVARFAPIVEAAKEKKIEVSGSISMAFGSPWDSEIPVSTVCSIIDAYLAAGVTEISLSDASGQAYPGQVYDICEEMKKRYPEVKFWLHFHNTRGLGIANILAGIEAGFTNFDSAFAGVGGCPFVPGATGNVASEDVVHAMKGCGVHTGIDLDMAIETARRVAEAVGHPTDSSMLRAGRADRILLRKE
ncbi:MAG: hydroxymethylglutaryl-CoA lyase [Lachnospiraceae bacterium]|nr:hydroxymethylglutaryl-CoA lyase [Lachnospiraceae bacterium]